MADSPREITQLLLEWSKGDRNALDRLMPVVYEELRQLARRYMAAERPGNTLQTTALIHEAYLRLIDQKEAPKNRAHFFAMAAQAMRRILVDHARTRDAAKRGGGLPKVSLEGATLLLTEQQEVELLALNDTLNELATVDPRKSRVVELRYFGGMSVEEAAEVLGVAPVTVMRDWRLAKAWILRELTPAVKK
jgi:RNA polymerase sigma factor (TIGR02999 family)